MNDINNRTISGYNLKDLKDEDNDFIIFFENKEHYQIIKSDLSVGSGENADIFFSPELVAPLQFWFFYWGPNKLVYIMDLGCEKPTMLNDKALIPGRAYLINNDDRITFGKCFLNIKREFPILLDSIQRPQKDVLLKMYEEEKRKKELEKSKIHLTNSLKIKGKTNLLLFFKNFISKIKNIFHKKKSSKNEPKMAKKKKPFKLKDLSFKFLFKAPVDMNSHPPIGFLLRFFSNLCDIPFALLLNEGLIKLEIKNEVVHFTNKIQDLFLGYFSLWSTKYIPISMIKYSQFLTSYLNPYKNTLFYYGFIYFSWQLLSHLIFGVSFSLFLFGGRGSGSFLTNRILGSFRYLLGIIFFPLFFLLDLPCLFKKRTFKEVLSFNYLKMKSLGFIINLLRLLVFAPFIFLLIYLTPFIRNSSILDDFSKFPKEISIPYSLTPSKIKINHLNNQEREHYFFEPYGLSLNTKDLRDFLIIPSPNQLIFYNTQKEQKIIFEKEEGLNFFKIIKESESSNPFFKYLFPSLFLKIHEKPIDSKKVSKEFLLYFEKTLNISQDPESIIMNLITFGPYWSGPIILRNKFLSYFNIKNISDLKFTVQLLGENPYIVIIKDKTQLHAYPLIFDYPPPQKLIGTFYQGLSNHPIPSHFFESLLFSSFKNSTYLNNKSNDSLFLMALTQTIAMHEKNLITLPLTPFIELITSYLKLNNENLRNLLKEKLPLYQTILSKNDHEELQNVLNKVTKKPIKKRKK